jgi:hypothetical protein
MGTRTGSIDPGVILHLLGTMGMPLAEVTRLLYSGSGLKGMSGVSQDVREIEAAGTEQAHRALSHFAWRVRREIGALAACLGGLDALVFTAGIGEHSAPLRAAICENLGFLGITLDPTDPTQRPHAAAALARRLGCVVVLKGAGTVVSDGLRAWTCTHGHPCMATAGTGDVLAGVIGGLAASSKGLPLYEIARIAVDVHARAGEAWALANNASAGMLAAELAAHIPALLEPLRPR